MNILFIVLKIIFLLFCSPIFVGLVRKTKALMQNRRGASVLQPYSDLWKLFHKDEVIAQDASWIFLLVPYLIFGISIALFMSVALIPGVETMGVFADFILVVGLLGLSAFLLSLAGMDTGGAFGGFGASREMTLNALTEGTLFFSFLPIALIAHSTNIITMSGFLISLPLQNYFPIFVAFLGYFIALMCETGRIPFDNDATHLELTMIHEAMILEYSGKHLALIEWANANKFLLFTLLGVNLFFPWTPHIGGSLLFSGAISLLFSLGKMLVLVIGIAILESSIAKFRLFRLPDLLLTGFIFGIIAIILSGV